LLSQCPVSQAPPLTARQMSDEAASGRCVPPASSLASESLARAKPAHDRVRISNDKPSTHTQRDVTLPHAIYFERRLSSSQRFEMTPHTNSARPDGGAWVLVVPAHHLPR
jgi:hypothetical protein